MSYTTQAECKAAIQQIADLSEFLLKYYQSQIGKGETVVDVVKRLLSPSTPVDDTNAKVPNWAVDTLAKKELRRLAQYMIDKLPKCIGEGSVVDSVIRCLDTAYANV